MELRSAAAVTAIGPTGLAAVILCSSLIDLPRQIAIGGLTAGAFVTFAVAGAFVGGILLTQQRVLESPPRPLRLLTAFVGWTLLCLVVGGVNQNGVQNVLVFAGFAAITTMSWAMVRRDPGAAASILRAVVAAGAVSFALYAASLAAGGLDSSAVFSPRGFALFALIPVAAGIALRRRHPHATAFALIGTALIVLSLSRLAAATAFLLLALGVARPGSPAGWVKLAATAAVGLGLFLALATYYQPLNQRFTQGDASSDGVAINLEGRTAVWSSAWSDFQGSPVWGHGAGASDNLASSESDDAIGHTHEDYLRLLDDYGLIGAGLWIAAFVLLLRRSFAAWQRSPDPHAISTCVHASAALSLIAIALGMLTDNVIIYLFVMAPAGALVGASLGLQEARA